MNKILYQSTFLQAALFFRPCDLIKKKYFKYTLYELLIAFSCNIEIVKTI